MDREVLLREWRALERRVVDAGEPPFAPLPRGELDRLAERYDLDGTVGILLESGWPARPLIVAGSDPFFWTVDELLAHGSTDPDWPREWFPFGMMSGFEVLCSTPDTEAPEGIWSVWCEGATEGAERLRATEGLVYKSLSAFIAAVRLNWEWVREEHLEARESGWFFFKESYPTLTLEAAEAIVRAFAPYFRDGPAILPAYASYAELLDPPLNCISTPLDERW